MLWPYFSNLNHSSKEITHFFGASVKSQALCWRCKDEQIARSLAVGHWGILEAHGTIVPASRVVQEPHGPKNGEWTGYKMIQKMSSGEELGEGILDRGTSTCKGPETSLWYVWVKAGGFVT